MRTNAPLRRHVSVYSCLQIYQKLDEQKLKDMNIIARPGLSNDSVTSDSPCCGVCKLDASAHYCIGCFRTRADIGAWSLASEAEKIAINQRALGKAKEISAQLQAKKRAG